MGEIILGIFVSAFLLGLVLALCVWAIEVWAAITGRRNGESDADFDARSCPKCGYDMQGSGDRCPECGTVTGDFRRYLKALASDWPDVAIDPVRPGPGDPLVRLFSLMDGHEADLIVQQLVARGVWAELEEHSTDENFGTYTRRITYHRIVVAKAEKESAEAIVQRFQLKAEPFGAANDDGDHDGMA